MRPLACSIKYPNPALAPTHSPTTAPMGATAVATRSPEASAGSAAGMRTWTRIAHALRECARRCAPASVLSTMVLARSTHPVSVRCRPSRKAAATGKKIISVAIATFDAMP